MTHSGRTLHIHITELRDLFLEMLCANKTAVDNPMAQPSAIWQRRSCLLPEEREMDGTDSFWAEGEEDGAEGFLDALENVFWFLMTQTSHGIREGSMADRPEEEKNKEREKEGANAKEEEGSSELVVGLAASAPLLRIGFQASVIQLSTLREIAGHDGLCKGIPPSSA